MIHRRSNLALLNASLVALLGASVAWSFSTSTTRALDLSSRNRILASSPASTQLGLTTSVPPEEVEDEVVLQIINPDAASDQWELDCYSRPVVSPTTNKKVWEVLICDSTGSFRYRQEIPSNQVNSKTLRQIVESLMEETASVVRPQTIRFFRGAMFNMINIALKELPDVTAKPSRCTFALSSWLEERHQNVYPKMEGYNPSMLAGAASSGPAFLNVRTPVKLPDALRGEQYAFVGLPLAEFLPGGGVSSETVGVGRLCPLPSGLDSMPAGDTFVQGVVLLTRRANALATWLAGTELVALQCDLRKRQLTMETDIDTTLLMARLDDQQRQEGAAFEQGKDELKGLHFVSVQVDEDSDPAGFWLLRELPANV